MLMQQLSTKTKLLCYCKLYGFTEGNEYTISYADSNGYYTTDDDGIEVLFDSIAEIKIYFMIE